MKTQLEKLYGPNGELHNLLQKNSKYSKGALFSFFERATFLNKQQLIEMLSMIGGTLTENFDSSHLFQDSTPIPFPSHTEDYRLIALLIKTFTLSGANTTNRQTITRALTALEYQILEENTPLFAHINDKMLSEEKTTQTNYECRVTQCKHKLLNKIAQLKSEQKQQAYIETEKLAIRESLTAQLKLDKSNLSTQVASLNGLKAALKMASPKTYEETYSTALGAKVIKLTIMNLQETIAAQQTIIDELSTKIEINRQRLTDHTPSKDLLDIEAELIKNIAIAEKQSLNNVAIDALITRCQKDASAPLSSFHVECVLTNLQRLSNALKKDGTKFDDFFAFLTEMTEEEQHNFFTNQLSGNRLLENFHVQSLLEYNVDLLDLVKVSEDKLRSIKSSVKQTICILQLGISFNILCHHPRFAFLDGVLNKKDEIQFLTSLKKNKTQTWDKIVSQLHIPVHYLLTLNKKALIHFIEAAKQPLEVIKGNASEAGIPVYEFLLKHRMDSEDFKAMAQEIENKGALAKPNVRLNQPMLHEQSLTSKTHNLELPTAFLGSTSTILMNASHHAFSFNAGKQAKPRLLTADMHGLTEAALNKENQQEQGAKNNQGKTNIQCQREPSLIANPRKDGFMKAETKEEALERANRFTLS